MRLYCIEGQFGLDCDGESWLCVFVRFWTHCAGVLLLVSGVVQY